MKKMLFTLIFILIGILFSCKEKITNSDSILQVAVLSPSSDSSYYSMVGSIPIVVQVTSDNPVKNVIVVIDSQVYQTLTSEPFFCMWNISNISGEHMIYAIVENEKGATRTSQTMKINIIDPNPTLDLSFIAPLSDSVNATDSVYLEVTSLNNAYNYLISKIELYVDSVLFIEHTPPPIGFWWKFNELKNTSVHSVYVTAYDWKNRSGKTSRKTIVAHRRISSSPLLLVGNKWFYAARDSFYTSSSGTPSSADTAFVTRKIIDTTSDGWRLVEVKKQRKDTTIITIEYWRQLGGDFYINEQVNNVWAAIKKPIYLNDLTNDRTESVNNFNYSWKLANYYFNNKNYDIQYGRFNPNLGSKASEYTTHGFSKEIGLVNYYREKIVYVGSITFNNSSAQLRGAFLNGVLIGDSTNTLK